MEKNVHFIWCDEWMISYDMIWKHDLFLIDRESEPGDRFSDNVSLAFHYVTLSFIGIGGEKHLCAEIKRRTII